MDRHDYAFPFRIDVASRQARRSSYQAHVAQMVRQVLLTSPGERADLPEFGCGLRAMIFAGNSTTTAAATQMLVQQSLERWLADHLTVRSVDVTTPDIDATVPEGELLVRVEYQLVATRETQRVDVMVG